MIVNKGVSIEQRKHNAESRPVSISDRCTFSINAEFLDSCPHHCPGCFVKRKNSFTEDDLDKLNNLAKQFYDKGFEVDELLLGPTDLFGCKNAEEILLHPKFKSLFKYFNALTFTSTLTDDPAHVKHIMDIIRSEYISDDTYAEVIIAFDIEKFNQNNDEYLSVFEQNLNEIPDVNVILAFNIHSSDIFDVVGIEKLSKILNEKYNCHLKTLPSFFRSNKTSLIVKNLEHWKKEINEQSIKQSSYALNNISDLYFGGYTYYVYSYKDSKLFRNIYFYDFNFEQHESLLIPQNDYGMYDLNTMFDIENNLTIEGFKYAKDTTNCDNCNFLSSCVSRRIITFMKNRDIKECFLPTKLMNYRNNTSWI